MSDYRKFYDERRKETYNQNYDEFDPTTHGHYNEVVNFLNKYSLEDKRVLEIGSSGGFFQDLVKDYYGTDIAQTLAKYHHKPCRVSDGIKL